LFGYFLGFVKAVREGKVIEGIAGKLAWVTFWIALLMFGLSFKVAGLVVLKLPLIIIIILSAMLVLFGSGGPSRNLFFKIAKGMFNLYQGLMGTVGDIISYSRLMALGLVTLGLATSINILVGVMAGIPYLSWILVPLLFIGGHVFSMGINVLGAYVHTLRLQYAEFFTKFFEGGGTPFKPFRKEAKYIIVSKK
jgi:V/A-type H+-transporting ATPase subunit I